MRLIVTGGAGFIGSAVIRHLLSVETVEVVNVDKLTYAGNPDSLTAVADHPRYRFEQVDICDQTALREVFALHRPDAVMHLAAESHVDRSIDGPADFIATNIVGTYNLLEASRSYRAGLSRPKAEQFRFHHISTDEVYGDLDPDEPAFTEVTSYSPSSPYSASKASSDHLVRAWGRTYGLPILITNCSNNYGPHQFPEKLVPTVILNALMGKPIPVYGQGTNVRDWLFVEDHAEALYTVLTRGVPGETYNIGGHHEMANIDVVRSICAELEQLAPNKPAHVDKYADLITFVTDRPGHDLRYAVDTSKIARELGWNPKESFQSGISKTVAWYLANREWCDRILSGSYGGQRLGLRTDAG